MKTLISAAPLAGLMLLAAAVSPATAGPPFLTDDPEIVPLHNSEYYVLWTNDVAPISEIAQIPGLEYNYGFARNAYAHIAIAKSTVEPPNGPPITGVGDLEAGVKLSFLTETAHRPQIAFYPMAEIATGKPGLGNGVTWYKLPIWLEKSFGPWAVYGGGGIGINHAPGQMNFGFGGIVLQRDVGTHLSLGLESFWQGSTDATVRPTSYANLGATWKPSEHFNVLLSAGHSYKGDPHTIGYAALYWIVGPAEH